MNKNFINNNFINEMKSIVKTNIGAFSQDSIKELVDKYIPIGKVTIMATSCFKDLSDITAEMITIEQQGEWDSYWKKTENIRKISHAVAKTNSANQKILTLTLLIMSGVINIKEDYNTLMSCFEKANEEYSHQIEVVEMINNLKNLLNEVKSKQNDIDDLKTTQQYQFEAIESLRKVVDEQSKIISSLFDKTI
jgi:hypothetical protein